MTNSIFAILMAAIITSCGPAATKKQPAGKLQTATEDNYRVKLITVDPGHFHAALVQMAMYPQVSPDVHVYAPDGPDLQQHLDRIGSYNNRKVDPTSWNEIIYRGQGFFEKMLAEKAGNVVVLSGNNSKKAEYISLSVEAGLNVLADKPMIITAEDFPKLQEAFRTAEQNHVLLYDIMTERFEVTTVLQKLLSQNEDIFGKLTAGTKDEPAVTKISVHHFSKLVSGSPLQRPAWFFDVTRQGEGIVDVTTHLVDLIQWECFPGQILSPSDINMVAARRWPTAISLQQFREVTGMAVFPGYLMKDVKNDNLNVFSNGEMLYQIKGKWAKVSVTWNYMAPPGGGDTHYSVMHGTQCDLVIKQGADEKFIPTLYVENIKGDLKDFTVKLTEAIGALPYDSLEVVALSNKSLKISIPTKYRISHEEHFGQVTEKFLDYLKDGKLPEWEVPGMITKYYTTTSALKKALER
ncbi:MAG: putative oxidoreductase C-terminal domain-containing protein [Bacteroidales bacterium]